MSCISAGENRYAVSAQRRDIAARQIFIVNQRVPFVTIEQRNVASVCVERVTQRVDRLLKDQRRIQRSRKLPANASGELFPLCGRLHLARTSLGVLEHHHLLDRYRERRPETLQREKLLPVISVRSSTRYVQASDRSRS